MFPPTVLQQLSATGFDATADSMQVGYRVISGDASSASIRVTITAWAIVFPDVELATQRYADLVRILGDVGADGRVHEPLAGVDGASFGSMSERANLIDERATVWVSSLSDGSDDRGAVLASTGGKLVRLLATNQYQATGTDRAVNLLEAIAERMAARERDLKLPPASNTMPRLPILNDTFALLTNATINANRYSSG